MRLQSKRVVKSTKKHVDCAPNLFPSRHKIKKCTLRSKGIRRVKSYALYLQKSLNLNRYTSRQLVYPLIVTDIFKINIIQEIKVKESKILMTETILKVTKSIRMQFFSGLAMILTSEHLIF